MNHRLATLARPLPLVAALAWAAAPRAATTRLGPAHASKAVVDELARQNLEASEPDVHWLARPRGFLASRLSPARAVVRAKRPGEHWDIFLVNVRTSPEGAVLGVEQADNLTRTALADEELLTTDGHAAAWAIGDRSRFYKIELADFAGERIPASDEWPRLARAERALMNLQRVGQIGGVGRRSFKLDPAARQLSLSFAAEELVALADDHRIGIKPSPGGAISGQRFVQEDDRGISQPGSFVTWAVDRARESSWFGDERMQLTKAVAYRALDTIDRAALAVHRPDENAAAAELGDVVSSPAAPTNPETGWPPAPLQGIVTPSTEGEGKWFLLDKDPFVRTTPGAPPALVTTYLRADGARPDTRVYVVEWDPRQVELGMVPGTEEPQSATGEIGNGMIPRDPRILSRLVAAFNGGFQSTHGDFGMMVDRRVLVPPKPYAATIARLRDGSLGFGTWPYDLATPPEFVSFRQNLTPLVGDGAFNPYGREWWGGVPHDWEDETHTVRSGLCLTREKFVAYFYATQIDHLRLGRAMLAARCDYGLHLDMNQGHTGLELYKVDVADKLPPISAKLDSHWQSEGDVSDMPGWRFRGRRLVRNMQLMHFPRYIRRGARDYFYLALRPVLPGAPLSAVSQDLGEGAWTIRDLAGGFPYSIATTSLRPDSARPEAKVRILKFDPSRLRVARDNDGPGLLAIREPSEASGNPQALWLEPDRASIGASEPSAGATRLVTGFRERTGPAVAATCVDADGMVAYAEVSTALDASRDAALLDRLLTDLGCSDRLFLRQPVNVSLAGRDLSDHPAPVDGKTIRLVRTDSGGARRIFRETPVLPPKDWMPLQRQTRFWPKESETAPSASAAQSSP
jgi:hypothetical protein